MCVFTPKPVLKVDTETTPCILQEMSYASALQPKMKKVRRTIYAIMGRLNLHDVRGRLDKQIENRGGVLAWSTLDSPPSGRLLRQGTADVETLVGEGWTHSAGKQPASLNSQPALVGGACLQSAHL
jgi:hypothetical protein